MIPQLIDHLWQSTLFVVAAWLITLALRRNRAQIRYWVWLAASVKFLIPFSLLVWIGTIAPSPVAPNEWRAVVDQIGQPFIAPAAAVQTVVVEQVASNTYLPLVALTLWICGLAAVSLRWLIRWRKMRTLRQSAVELHITEIPVLSSQGFLEPGIFGIFRPVLLLPEGIIARLEPAQLDAILAHELCHIRRRDNLTAAVHMTVEAIFWFHPLVWWLGTRLVDERERACDEEVLRRGGDPSVYAQGILNVCKFYVESPLTCVSGVTGSNLKTRIEAIMKNRIVLRLNSTKKVVLTVAGVAALALPLVIGMMNAPSMRAQSAATAPKFEVSSIRPCEPGAEGRFGRGGEPPTASLRLVCNTVAQLITSAYDTAADGRKLQMIPILPISGGPSWINTERYSINSKAEGTPSEPMMRGPMLRALLEDRFQLKIRRESRDIPVYVLTVSKGGPKLKASQEGICPTPNPAGGSCPGSLRILREGSSLVLDQQDTLDGFTRTLFQRVRRLVIDKTGITGMFDFHLEFAFDEAAGGPAQGVGNSGGAPGATPSGPSIFTAVQEQLGLKLDAAKGPGEFLVVDSVERPSEN